jgi:hypothetical protein
MWPMPRTLRAETEGAMHYVVNRGDRRELIFQNHQDREGFINKFQEICY